MRLLLVTLACLVTVKAIIPVNTFYRAFRRAGIDTHDIPVKAIQKFSRGIETAKTMKELDKSDQEFLNDLTPIQRKRFGRGWVKTFSTIMSLFIKIQTALTNIFKSTGYSLWAVNKTYNNFKTGWQRSIVQYDGDFEQVHINLKRVILKELKPHLTTAELNDLKKKMDELDRRESKVLRMAFALTRKEAPAKKPQAKSRPTSNKRVPNQNRKPKQ